MKVQSQFGKTDDASFALLLQHRPAFREPLGFEVVGVEFDLALHSWHCHGYADQAMAELGIALTDRGLLASSADARAVRDWMLELPSNQAPKEVPWTFVALIPS